MLESSWNRPAYNILGHSIEFKAQKFRPIFGPKCAFLLTCFPDMSKTALVFQFFSKPCERGGKSLLMICPICVFDPWPLTFKPIFDEYITLCLHLYPKLPIWQFKMTMIMIPNNFWRLKFSTVFRFEGIPKTLFLFESRFVQNILQIANLNIVWSDRA